MSHAVVPLPLGLTVVDEHALDAFSADSGTRDSRRRIHLEHQNVQTVFQHRPQRRRWAISESHAFAERLTRLARVLQGGVARQGQFRFKPSRLPLVLPGQLPVHRDPPPRSAFEFVDGRARHLRTRPEREFPFTLQAERVGEVVQIDAEQVHRQDELLCGEGALPIFDAGDVLAMVEPQVSRQSVLRQAGSFAGRPQTGGNPGGQAGNPDSWSHADARRLVIGFSQARSSRSAAGAVLPLLVLRARLQSVAKSKRQHIVAFCVLQHATEGSDRRYSSPPPVYSRPAQPTRTSRCSSPLRTMLGRYFGGRVPKRAGGIAPAAPPARSVPPAGRGARPGSGGCRGRTRCSPGPTA